MSLLVSSGCKGTWKPCVSHSVWSSYPKVHSPSQEQPCVSSSLLPCPDGSAGLQQTELVAEQRKNLLRTSVCLQVLLVYRICET